MKLCVRDHKRDKDIVFLRDNKGWTYPQIAKKYNVTKARARQLYIRVKQDEKKKKAKENTDLRFTIHET